VVGGTIAALMVSFPGDQIAKVPKHLRIIFSPTQYNPGEYIRQLVEFAKKARISGLLALEEDLQSIENAFLKSSMLMVVDSVDPEKVKQQLETRMDHLDERHAQERALYIKGSAYAPAFGMIGTLIGLINLLKDLQDIDSVGPNMAVALITTFYGTILANLIFTPIANKLQVRHEEEYLCNMIICEGVQAIQAGENPKFIQERLLNLLPQYKQVGIGDSGDDDGGGGKKGKRK
jgi:chemotaxis protein MotA